MARTLIPLAVASTSGFNISTGGVAADQPNGMYIPRAGADVILVVAMGATPTTLTLKLDASPDPGTAGTERQPAPTINVFNVIGPFPIGDYDQGPGGGPGGVWIDFTSGTSVFVQAIAVPKRPDRYF